jgi:hypothetical protein
MWLINLIEVHWIQSIGFRSTPGVHTHRYKRIKLHCDIRCPMERLRGPMTTRYTSQILSRQHDTQTVFSWWLTWQSYSLCFCYLNLLVRTILKSLCFPPKPFKDLSLISYTKITSYHYLQCPPLPNEIDSNTFASLLSWTIPHSTQSGGSTNFNFARQSNQHC